MSAVAPATGEEIAGLLADASASGRPVRVVGRGTRSRRGPEPAAGTAWISTEGLAEVVDHVPADLTITVGAGMPVATLDDHLAAHGQEWAQAGGPPGASVGGVLATASSGRRRLAHGPVRDSLLEVVLATGDGRLVRGGGRTVKNVSGYDLPRLAVGSWGVLGVLTRVTLKLWPLPAKRAWFGADGPLEEREWIAAAALAARASAAVLLTPGRITISGEGQPADVVAPAGTAESTAPGEPAGAALLRGGVPPAAVVSLARWAEEQGIAYEVQAGVGGFTAAVDDIATAQAVSDRVHALGGHAEVIDAPPELRDVHAPPPAGLTIMKRLKGAFDPAGILNAGLLGEEI